MCRIKATHYWNNMNFLLLLGICHLLGAVTAPPPPHNWPQWKPRKFFNAIVTRNSWDRYLSTLKQYPGSVNAVSEYMYEIGYQIPANWSLKNHTPYALNFSKAVQALDPKVAVENVHMHWCKQIYVTSR
eukprot:m.110340 g.110340  ORF g.110340 m.110340 type:complete len:129 (+) comp14036_c0_seq6:310-696(+)